MQIKMGISMELEEVPEKLIEYLSVAEEKLSSKIKKVKEGLARRVVEPSIVSDIQSVKKELLATDQVLQDCSEVITSYNNVLLQQKAAYLERQMQQETPDSVMQGTGVDGN